MITMDQYQIMEKRIENCFAAADKAIDKHMKNMWYQKGMYLVRQLANINREMYVRSNQRI